MEKKKPRMLTARKFAQEMKISYTTIMAWLDAGIVPGAALADDERGPYWQIPETALKMERPKRGRKPKSENVGEAKPAKKAAKKAGN
jgi:hypothetical protein